MPQRTILWSVLFFLFVVHEVHSQHRISLQLGTSLPVNIAMPLTIEQNGQPVIHMSARYSSEPFVVPICWVWRIGYWSGKSAWELEAIHHKLFLDNTSPEVESFSVSHGWNLLTVNRVWDLDDFLFRFGFGVVLTHPESVIRGKKYGESGGIFGLGYFVSGPAVTVGGGRRVSLTDQFYLTF